MPVLMIFIDGFGLGSSNPAVNPFATAEMHLFRRILHGKPLTLETIGEGFVGDGVVIKPTDATLEVPGIPQSATGQTAFLAGLNTAKLAGRHIHGFPTRMLREKLNESSIFKVIKERNFSTAFANTFTSEYFETVSKGKWRHSATTTAALAGGCRLRMVPDLLNNEAVYHDLTNQILQEKGYVVPIIEPEQAARNLLKIASQHDFVLFEYFQTDRCGHAQDWETALTILNRIDRFLGVLIDNLPPQQTLLVNSDHGNIEDLSIKTHTKNPVPTIAFGRDLELFHNIKTLLDIYSSILQHLGMRSKTQFQLA